MRRDVGFYVEAGIQEVYQAYLNAATNKPFERECKQEPYHTISFGVNYSFKYNMNGGSCSIHFMPYGSGTAVNMRFSIAQAVGARYGRYAEDLNKAMREYLPRPIQEKEFDMDEFLKPQNRVTPASLQNAPTPAPVVTAAPVATPVPAPEIAATKFCTGCGAPVPPNGRFCTQCGKAVQKCCPSCNAPAAETSLFCANCGTRL